MPSQACPFNDTLFREGLQQLPQHWLRHFSPRSISLGQQQKTWRGLKGWGRTLFVIQRGRLLYAPLAPTGCMLRRTPILAWALLETLERHPDLPDVSIPFNCRDQPLYWYPDGLQPQGGYEISTTATTSDGKPALVFSYTTGHTFSDIPFPDYTFWGLPYAHIPPWERWLAEREGAPSSRWENKIDKLLWVGTTGVGNGAAGSTSHRLLALRQMCACRLWQPAGTPPRGQERAIPACLEMPAGRVRHAAKLDDPRGAMQIESHPALSWRV